MAAKSKTRLVDQPPSASSSDEDEDPSEHEEVQNVEAESNGEEDTVEAESDGEEDNAPLTPILNKDLDGDCQSSSERDDVESEPESQQTQPSPSASDFTIKPIAPPKPPSASPTKAPAPKPSAKRASEAQEKDSKKRSKTGEGDGPAEEKKSAASAGSKLLWSEEDQVAVLKGMVDYKAQRGSDPYTNMSAFYDFIKDKLHVEFSKYQMTEKIRRLRKKFLNSYEKGDNPPFAKPHDSQCFELSKKIWGNATSTANGKSPNAISKPIVQSADEKVKKPGEVKKISEPKKSVKITNNVDTPNNEEESKKRKKKNATKDEENEKKKKKQKIAQVEKDNQIVAVEEKDKQISLGEKDKQSVDEEKDEQIAVQEKDKQIADEEKYKQIAIEGKDEQNAIKELANGEIETEEGDFKSKYPHFANSFSKKNYPLSSQETIDMLKGKLSLVGSQNAEELEEEWIKLWEEHAELCGKMAGLLARQMKLVVDVIKR